MLDWFLSLDLIEPRTLQPKLVHNHHGGRLQRFHRWNRWWIFGENGRVCSYYFLATIFVSLFILISLQLSSRHCKSSIADAGKSRVCFCSMLPLYPNLSIDACILGCSSIHLSTYKYTPYISPLLILSSLLLYVHCRAHSQRILSAPMHNQNQSNTQK